jgi:hypothetical protein
MESVTILSFAALAGFACYFAIVDTSKTWIRIPSTEGIFFAATWKYENWQLMTGFCIGVVSAALSLTSILFIGASKQVRRRSPYLDRSNSSCYCRYSNDLGSGSRGSSSFSVWFHRWLLELLLVRQPYAEFRLVSTEILLP